MALLRYLYDLYDADYLVLQIIDLLVVVADVAVAVDFVDANVFDIVAVDDDMVAVVSFVVAPFIRMI